MKVKLRKTKFNALKKSISFFDTSCSLVNSKKEVDLFRKESDRNQYIIPNDGILK